MPRNIVISKMKLFQCVRLLTWIVWFAFFDGGHSVPMFVLFSSLPVINELNYKVIYVNLLLMISKGKSIIIGNQTLSNHLDWPFLQLQQIDSHAYSSLLKVRWNIIMRKYVDFPNNLIASRWNDLCFILFGYHEM